MSRPASTCILGARFASTSSFVPPPPQQARPRPIRKQYLLEQYKHVLRSSGVVVFLKPADFSVAELTRLRVELAAIESPPPLASTSRIPGALSSSSTSDGHQSGSPSPSSPSIVAAAEESGLSRPRFLFVRAGLLQPTFRQMRNVPSKNVLAHLEQHKGNIALLTLPTLHPPSLKAALAAIKKLSDTDDPRQQVAAAAAAKKAGAGKSQSADGTKAARLPVISALIEGKEVLAPALHDMASLPPLDEILAQLVAVLETPARNIIGLSTQAAGLDLVRTLEGFRVGLEEAQAGDQGAAQQ